MVSFEQFLSKKKLQFSDENQPKMTIVCGLKLVNFNRTPALYLRGYGILLKVSVLTVGIGEILFFTSVI